MQRSRIYLALGAFLLAILGVLAVRADKKTTAYTGAVYTCLTHSFVFNCEENTLVVQLTTTIGINRRATFGHQILCTIHGMALYFTFWLRKSFHLNSKTLFYFGWSAFSRRNAQSSKCHFVSVSCVSGMADRMWLSKWVACALRSEPSSSNWKSVINPEGRLDIGGVSTDIIFSM